MRRLDREGLAWREGAAFGVAHSQQRGAKTRGRVLDMMRACGAPRTVKQLSRLSGCSQWRVRRALERLAAQGLVARHGPANHRKFVLRVPNTGEGNGTGVHASASAAEALAGRAPTSAARRGDAAE